MLETDFKESLPSWLTLEIFDQETINFNRYFLQ